MVGTHRILAITSQPGDETFALGGVLARYVDEGARVHLVCATLGESGRVGASEGPLPAAVLGRLRERELHAAAEVLGIQETVTLGYPDGAVGTIDPFRLQMDLAAYIRRLRPHVVLVIGRQGPGGDPDRTAIAEATHAAILAAARHSAPVPGGHTPHAVRKVYERVWSEAGAASEGGVGWLPGRDGTPSLPLTPEWMVTTVVRTREHAHRARAARRCHRSRPFCTHPGAPATEDAPSVAWDRAEFIRSLSTVEVPSGLEEDLLAGIRRYEARSFRADRISASAA
jgi:LmbE family N-acetylglucosaminyl deacetylase